MNFFTIFQQIKLKNTPKKHPLAVTIMNNNLYAIIYDSQFYIYNPVNKEETKEKLKECLEECNVYAFKNGFVIYESKRNDSYHVEIYGNRVEVKKVKLYLPNDCRLVPLFCWRSQKLLYMVIGGSTVFGVYEIGKHIMDGIKNVQFNFVSFIDRACMIEQWIISKRINSKFLALKNLQTKQDMFLEFFQQTILKVCFLTPNTIIFTRKSQQHVYIQTKIIQQQQSQLLLTFPSKTNIQFKIVFDKLVGIQTDTSFLFFDWINKQIKWSTDKFHKKVWQMKAVSLNLQEMILEGNRKLYRQRFIKKINIYRYLCKKVKGFESNQMVERIVGLLKDENVN